VPQQQMRVRGGAGARDRFCICPCCLCTFDGVIIDVSAADMPVEFTSMHRVLPPRPAPGCVGAGRPRALEPRLAFGQRSTFRHRPPPSGTRPAGSAGAAIIPRSFLSW